MTWTLEDRLILYCCQRKIQDEVRKDRGNIADTIDWNIFLEKARKEGVSSLVFLRLPDLINNTATVPSEITEELKRDYYTTAARNSVIFEELGNVLKMFKRAGIEAVVLKGAALAETVYGNPALRSMSDVDLLIKKKDLFAVHRAFENAGYYSPDAREIDLHAVPADYLTTLVYMALSGNGACFHVHWHMVNSTIPNESLIKDVTMPTIWRDAHKARIAGVEALVMAPHHLLIHLAEHSLRVSHSLNKLCFLCDINEAVEFYGDSMDWDRLISESRHFNLDWLVYVPLYCAAELLNTNIPKEVLLRLRPERFTLYERFFIRLAANNHRFSGLSYLLHLSCNKGVSEKIRFVLSTLFPPRHVIAHRCGISQEKIGYIFYLRRMHEVFMALARSVRKIFGTVV